MFCDNCGRDVLCANELRDRVVLIHGVKITVQYRANLCGCCKNEIFDEAVEAKIMQTARDQYRRKKNMLPADRLRGYMKDHGLSAAEMAERTGCAVGEIIAASTGRLLDAKIDARIKKAVGQ